MPVCAGSVLCHSLAPFGYQTCDKTAICEIQTMNVASVWSVWHMLTLIVHPKSQRCAKLIVVHRRGISSGMTKMQALYNFPHLFIYRKGSYVNSILITLTPVMSSTVLKCLNQHPRGNFTGDFCKNKWWRLIQKSELRLWKNKTFISTSYQAAFSLIATPINFLQGI